ncbi:MAG: hypothetical protein WCU88_06110 [Elusimicrobiota bacterium]|jgi:hypothetical protein
MHLLLPLLLAAASPSCAQFAPGYLPLFDGGSHSVGFKAGVVSPTDTNGFSSLAQRGKAILLHYRFYPLDWVAVGADAGMENFSKKIAPDGSSSSADAMLFTPILRVNLVREMSWTPYLFGGFGFNQFTLKSSALKPGDPSKTAGLALSAGGGFEFFVLRGMSVFFEGRYDEFRRPKSSQGSFQAVGGQLGLAVWFNYD